MTARGLRRSISDHGVSNGSSSLYTLSSRTRRAMSCAVWPPKSRTMTLSTDWASSSGARSGAGASSATSRYASTSASSGASTRWPALAASPWTVLPRRDGSIAVPPLLGASLPVVVGRDRLSQRCVQLRRVERFNARDFLVAQFHEQDRAPHGAVRVANLHDRGVARRAGHRDDRVRRRNQPALVFPDQARVVHVDLGQPARIAFAFEQKCVQADRALARLRGRRDDIRAYELAQRVDVAGVERDENTLEEGATVKLSHGL